MKKKIITVVICVALIIVAFLFSRTMVNNKPTPTKNATVENTINVKTAVVTTEKVKHSISYPGRVSSFQNVSLSSETNGKIIQGNIPLKEGQAFNQGDLLIQIYEKDAEATLKASKSTFLKTISLVLPDISIDYPDSYVRWNSFFRSIDLDKKLPELPVIKNENERIFLASNSVLSEYYSLQKMEIDFSKHNITAPFDGYYKTVSKEVGAYANTGVEIAKIIRADKLEIIVGVTTNDAKKIKTGQTVKLITNETELEGKVARIAGFVDQNTQAVNIYIVYNSQRKNELFEGEYIMAEFGINTEDDGFKINREAVIDDSYVFVIEKNQLRKKQIRILQKLEDKIIIAGVNSGDTVVVESLINVTEGQNVTVFN